LLDWVPGGSHWKGEFLRRQKGKVGLVAQPNQLLGERIMPEIVDVVTARQVAGEVAALLQDRVELQQKGLLIQQAYERLAGCSRKMLDCLAPL
jgi:lipid A disaccharide synthetase